MKKNLKINDSLEYEFDLHAIFEKDGNEYEFISFKKITTFKNNTKYQNLTVKPEHWEKFRLFLQEIIEGEEVPF